MILTVTLNPALDLTYRVDALVKHTTNRVREVAERPGGKGLNVARVLRAAGEPVLATGLLGGATGARIGALLAEDGVKASFVDIGRESRRTVVIADGDDATGLWEPGPMVSAGEWAAFTDHYRALVSTAEVVVLSGSLPPGVPADGYATLVRIAAAQGARTVLDASGEALRHGVAAGPDIAKPNAEELAVFPTPEARAVVAAGARAAVVSFGRRGLVALADGRQWRVPPPEVVEGNPTGAGDACAAALARGLRDGTPWPQLLADAAALSAAAVAAPVAGAFDPETYARLRPQATVEPA